MTWLPSSLLLVAGCERMHLMQYWSIGIGNLVSLPEHSLGLEVRGLHLWWECSEEIILHFNGLVKDSVLSTLRSVVRVHHFRREAVIGLELLPEAFSCQLMRRNNVKSRVHPPRDFICPSYLLFLQSKVTSDSDRALLSFIKLVTSYSLLPLPQR